MEMEGVGGRWKMESVWTDFECALSWKRGNLKKKNILGNFGRGTPSHPQPVTV